MKKNLLAVSVAAALALGAGAASAAVTVAPNGIGHTNIIPYFSVQGGNMTLLSITNTDTVVGKLVKVRFRGAEWSDDIFDFQVFLSPGDVFTGAVTNNNGVASFATSDATCTLPTSVNQDFVPIRLQNTATGTLEGYIEIITMADINPAGTVASGGDAKGYSLATAITHVGGVAPCMAGGFAGAAVTGLLQQASPVGGVDSGTGNGQWGVDGIANAGGDDWMMAPGTAVGSTAGALTSYATIINVNSSKAFANLGTAVNYTTPKLAYFRQANDAIAAPVVGSTLTYDRAFFALDSAATELLYGGNGGTAITMYDFDMPDLSTTIDTGPLTAEDARDNLSMALQKASVMTEFSTEVSIAAASDVVLNQPTRRFFYNYWQNAANTDMTIGANKFKIYGDVDTPYENLVGSTNRVALAGSAVFYDRNEQKAASNIVISPTPPGGTLSLKGEVSVIGINVTGSTGALGASLTTNGIQAVGAGGATYDSGWALLSTTTTATVAAPYATAALPIIGFSAQNAFNAAAGASGTNYGTTLPLRYY